MKLFAERNIKDDDVSPAFEKAAKKRRGLFGLC